MDRVVVVGNSGSGKTTLARGLADTMAVPHLELDSVKHQPGWTELPLAEMRERVAQFAAQPRWVIDGNYWKEVGDITWAAADTAVWLDLDRGAVMRQLLRRTVTRTVTRQELWNGNRESLRNVVSRDPMRSILRWGWTQHAAYRERYGRVTSSPDQAHLEVVRLTSPREVRDWLTVIARAAT